MKNTSTPPPRDLGLTFALSVGLAVIGLVLAGPLAEAQPGKKVPPAAQEQATSFLRVMEKAGEESMDTAVATYTGANDIKVHLVGAVHIADAAYYESLNQLFDSYDALLYELVGDPTSLTEKDAEKNKKKGKKSSGVSFIGLMQRSAGRFLELKHQLPSIDYRKDHFVHADMTAEEFEEARDERDESMLTFIIKTIEADMKLRKSGQIVDDDDEPGLLDIIKAFAADDSATRFKRMIAKQFKTSELTTMQIEKDGGTTIITDRNKVAFAKLKESIAGGKKNIGIFYGAAHMQDLEERLRKIGFQRTGLKWITAWDMRSKEQAERKK